MTVALLTTNPVPSTVWAAEHCGPTIERSAFLMMLVGTGVAGPAVVVDGGTVGGAGAAPLVPTVTVTVCPSHPTRATARTTVSSAVRTD